MKKVVNYLTYPRILVGSSFVGLVAAFWQATERIHMLKNPTAVLSCNLNPVVDCGSVLNNKLAAVFGPPNAFIGMVAFAILFAFGLQRLGVGQWTKLSRVVVVLLSKIMVLFSLWFFWVSLYSIGKICVFCIFIWAASMPIGIYGIKDYLENTQKLPDYQEKTKKFLQKNHFSLLVAVYATMLALFLVQFKDYYFR